MTGVNPCKVVEVGSGFEPLYKVLQTSALATRPTDLLIIDC